MQQQNGEKPIERKEGGSISVSPTTDPFMMPMSLPPAGEPLPEQFVEPKLLNPSLGTSLEDFPIEEAPTLSHSVQTNDTDTALQDPFPDLMKSMASADGWMHTSITDLMQADL